MPTIAPMILAHLRPAVGGGAADMAASLDVWRGTLTSSNLPASVV